MEKPASLRKKLLQPNMVGVLDGDYQYVFVGSPRELVNWLVKNKGNLSGLKIDFKTLCGIDFTSADFSNCYLVGSDFSGCNLSGANFKGADLSNCKFSGVTAPNCDFTGCNLTEATLKGSDFSGSKFNESRLFTTPHIAGCKFNHCDFTSCSIRFDCLCCDFSGAKMELNEHQIKHFFLDCYLPDFV